MSQGSRNFRKTLAQGLTFEQGEAIAILHEVFPDYYIMNNQVDPVGSTGGEIIGPRLYLGKNREEEYIAPDFVLFDNTGHAIWIDAKLKGTTYPFKGLKYFSVDRVKHDAYNKFPMHMKENFFFLFKNGKTGEVYIGRFNSNPQTTFFDNKHDTGQIPMYFVNDLTKLEISNDK